MKQFYIHAMTDDCEEWNEQTTDFVISAADAREAAKAARERLNKSWITGRMVIDEVREIKNE